VLLFKESERDLLHSPLDRYPSYQVHVTCPPRLCPCYIVLWNFWISMLCNQAI